MLVPNIVGPIEVRIEAVATLASANLGSLTNIGEVLKNDGTASYGVLHDAFREDVITVPAEAPLLATQLFQVMFS